PPRRCWRWKAAWASAPIPSRARRCARRSRSRAPSAIACAEGRTLQGRPPCSQPELGAGQEAEPRLRLLGRVQRASDARWGHVLLVQDVAEQGPEAEAV